MSRSNAYTRREFVGQALMMASAAGTIPWFLDRSALALPRPGPMLGSLAGVPEDRILVVIQMAGGNDGLNTIVPFASPEYYRARPGIAIRENEVLKLDNARGIGLHPRLAGVKSLYDEGLCAIVQGVGYPNPNRSHFKSMDIWHTADTSGVGEGWIGKYFDSQCCGYGKGESGRPEQATTSASMPGIAIGREAPLAMEGRQVKPIAFETEDLFRWTGRDVHPALGEPYERLNARGEGVEPSTNANFLMRTALDAQVSSEMIRKAVRQPPLVQYPNNSDLSRQLSMIASMIRAGLPTRVYYATIGGFDTHAGQGGANGNHANLLNAFSSAVRAFYADLKAQENDGRVLTMSFSEFGRRVGQNASQGTDHGTAAPMFLFGPMVRAGVLSEHPSMTRLDSGDLVYGTDFREVYAGLLEGWMKADANAVLGERFRALPVVAKG